MIALYLLLASPTFPVTVQNHLSLPEAPECTLCHATEAGGLGTVTRPFGVTLRARGAQAGDTASVVTALNAMAAEGTDSDGDGTGDIDELLAGTNPNGGEGPEPEYGCFGRIGGGRPSGLSALLAALSLVTLLLRGRSGSGFRFRSRRTET